MHREKNTLDSSPLLGWMVRRIAHELGTSETEVDPHARLMSLGIDSLALVGLAGELAELIGRDVPAEILWEYESIAEIAENLESTVKGLTIPPASGSWPSENTTRNRHLSEASRWSPLRAIQARGKRAPLFLVHDVIGGVGCYHQLSKELGEDQPVFGLQQLPDPPDSIEQMAAVLLDALQTIQRKGPYRLGGYCFGGVIAYEMVLQLEKRGENASLLAMFDTPSPPRIPQKLVQDTFMRTSVAAYSLLHGPLYLARQFVQDRPQVAARFARQLGRWSHRLRYRCGLTQEPAMEHLVSQMFNPPLDVHRKHLAALGAYRPATYSGCLTFFQSAESRCFQGTIPWQWRKLAAGGIRLCQVPGAHALMLSAPAVRSVAEPLRVQLERAEA